MLRGTGGEIPPVYPTHQSSIFGFFVIPLLYLHPHIVFLFSEIVYLEIVYSLCEIHTLAEVYKSAINKKLQFFEFISDFIQQYKPGKS